MEPAQTPQTAYPDPSNEKKKVTLADVFRAFSTEYLKGRHLDDDTFSALQAILRCRTEAMGGYLETCEACHHIEYRYNSCSNRNCPTCQWLRQIRWSIKQLSTFLPVAHHQAVTTLPGKLRALARANKRVVYDLILRVTSETIRELVQERYGATVGLVCVLHTWNRELGFHLHVHVVVSCGGLSLDGSRWVSIPRDFFLPVAQLRSRFRQRMIQALRESYQKGKLTLPASVPNGEAFEELLETCSDEKWVVHVEPPVGQSSPVVKYLSQYVNRIGMSNSRLVSMDEGRVTFETRDGQTLTLGGAAFVERFLEHVVPSGFHKVRMYGLYSPTGRHRNLEKVRGMVPLGERVEHQVGEGLDGEEPWEELVKSLTGRDPRCCPKCGGTMIREAFGKPRYGKSLKGAKGKWLENLRRAGSSFKGGRQEVNSS